MDIRDILTLTVLLMAVAPIIRWGIFGAFVNVPVGWLSIHLVHMAFPLSGWDESAEDWSMLGWFLMLQWSTLVFGVVSFLLWIKRRLKGHS